MLHGNYLIYYYITQISSIFPITYGKFKFYMVTIINQVMKLKYYYDLKKTWQLIK